MEYLLRKEKEKGCSQCKCQVIAGNNIDCLKKNNGVVDPHKVIIDVDNINNINDERLDGHA